LVLSLGRRDHGGPGFRLRSLWVKRTGGQMRAWGVVCLGVLFVLMGCGQAANTTNTGLPTFDVPKLDEDRERMLTEFPVLDASEEEAPPIDPLTKRSPFGVLIYMPAAGKGTFCSTSHVSRGVIAANAHCVDSPSRPSDYFVVYYDKKGFKRFERVVEFQYVGDVNSDDIAILRIAGDAVDAWDNISSPATDTRAEIGHRPAISRNVTVWSFNPFKDNHPDLYLKYAGWGMRFTPRHCLASRTRPKLLGITTDEEGEEVRRIPIVSGASQEKMHYFVDNCDIRPVKGNSGSLITASNDITQKLGVFHWLVPAETTSMNDYNHFIYEGNDQMAQTLSWEDMKHRDFFGVGTDFGFLLAKRPGLF
jgi:hypothetical protein